MITALIVIGGMVVFIGLIFLFDVLLSLFRLCFALYAEPFPQLGRALKRCYKRPFGCFCEYIYSKFLSEPGEEFDFIVLDGVESLSARCAIRDIKYLQMFIADNSKPVGRMLGYHEPFTADQKNKIHSFLTEFKAHILYMEVVKEVGKQFRGSLGQFLVNDQSLFVEHLFCLLWEEQALNVDSTDAANNSGAEQL